MDQTPVIRVQNLCKAYNGVPVLDDITFDVGEGEIIGLVGPNGAGKSTLIETIEGLRKIDKGYVEVLGRSLNADYKAVQGSIGIQLQRTSLMGDITLNETLDLFKTLYKVNTANRELLERVNLAEMAGKKVKHLSGGQYQRFNLCLAILNSPGVLFLDEPTTGLDPIARRQLWSIIAELKSKKVTIIITTHYLDEARALCDKILILSDHKIVAYDTPENLIQKLDNEKTIVVSGLGELNQLELGELESKFKVVMIDGQVILYTYDIGRVLNELFEWINLNQKRADDINIRSANLEDVFMLYSAPNAVQKGELK